MSFFYPDQAYPGNDPLTVARQMGLRPEEAMRLMMGGQAGPPMGGGMGQPDYDPNMIAQMIGQQYNPYQGYPNKQVSDQAWDVFGPMDEYLLPQMYNIQNPDAGGFDLDAFFQTNPTIRGPLAEAYEMSEGDPIRMLNYLNSNEPETVERVNEKGEVENASRAGFQDRFRQEIGRTEWEDLARQGYQPIVQAARQGATGEELDDIALDYYMRGLEDVLAAGSPTSARAMQQLDYTRQREGFRPAPGTGQELPGYSGPGFGGGPGGAMGGGGADVGSNIPVGLMPNAPQAYEDGSVDLGDGSFMDSEGAIMGGRRFELPEGRIPGPDFGQSVYDGVLGQLVSTRNQPMPSFDPDELRQRRNVSRVRRGEEPTSSNRPGGGGQRGGGGWRQAGTRFLNTYPNASIPYTAYRGVRGILRSIF